MLITSVMGLQTTAFASEPTSSSQQTEVATVNDVKALKPYVEINEDGTLSLNAEEALANGAKEQAVEALQGHFGILNEEIKNGEISVAEDLTIIGGEKEFATHYCSRGINSYSEFWWGYQRKACDCESNRIANDLNTAAAGGGMVTGAAAIASVALAAIFPPAVPIANLIGGGAAFDGSYWWLVASRITANNNGRGVIMDMTYALFFDITPQ